MPTVFNQSLWGDEAFSAVLSMNPIPKILEIIQKDTSPPLYNLILHYWYQIFGTGEVAIRALSFLYFILAVFFVYKIGSLLFSRKTGFLAAVLTFLNPFFFTYAFEGRMYSILALGVVASMYFFLKKQWTLYVIATLWALYSHHFSIFAVMVQGLWFLYELVSGERKTVFNMFKSFVAIIVLYIPWLIPLYKQTKMVGGGFWLGTPTLVDLRNLIYEYLAEGIKKPLINIPFINKNLGQISLYLVMGILLLCKWTKNIKKTLFLLSWFLLPIAIAWGISQKFTSIFFNRYLLYTIPAAMLILASNGRKYAGILVGILLICFGIIDYNYFTHPAKKPFSEMASYVKLVEKPGDFLINWNSNAHHLWESKYYGISAPIYLPNGKLPFYVGTAQMTDKDIVSEIPPSERIGIITSGQDEEVNVRGYKKESVKIFGELKFITLTHTR